MSEIYHCSKVVVEKARTFPTGRHGDVLEVGKNEVIAIDYCDGTMFVTGNFSGKPVRFIVRDWLHGNVVGKTSDELKCECGETFKNTQGYGLHRKTCPKAKV